MADRSILITGCPLSLSNIRAPLLPVLGLLFVLLQSLLFLREILMLVNANHLDEAADELDRCLSFDVDNLE